MVKVFIYKEYDLVEELEKIWLVSGLDGARKDKMIRELISSIKEAAEITLKKNGNN